MIEKYIYAVIKLLPEKSRKDVEEDLRSNINDMLPSNYSEKDVELVLIQLGNPKNLAREYMDKKQYLIGPAFFATYIYVLKLVCIIVASVLPFLIIFASVKDSADLQVTQLLINIIIKTISMYTEAAIYVFAWVTIVFTIMERVSNFSDKKNDSEWSVSQLQEIPNSKDIISKSEPILSIIFSVIGLSILYFAPQLLTVIANIGGEIQTAPIFNILVLNKYWIPIFIISSFMIIIEIMKIYYRKWNLQLIILNNIYNVLSIIFLYVFLLNMNLFNLDALSIMAEKTSISIELFIDIWRKSMLAISLMITTLSIISSIKNYFKYKRSIK